MGRKKSEFVSAFDIASCVFKSLTNAVMDKGGSDEDVRRIETDKGLCEKIADLIVGSGSPTLSRDMRKEGWELIEAGPKCSITSAKDDLELVSFFKQGEDSINGEEMFRRARKELNANLGQEDAEWLLAHQNEIPKEWQEYYLVFPGTVWQGRSGGRSIPYLSWYGGRWYLSFVWLEDDWSGFVRLVRRK